MWGRDEEGGRQPEGGNVEERRRGWQGGRERVKIEEGKD